MSFDGTLEPVHVSLEVRILTSHGLHKLQPAGSSNGTKTASWLQLKAEAERRSR